MIAKHKQDLLVRTYAGRRVASTSMLLGLLFGDELFLLDIRLLLGFCPRQEGSWGPRSAHEVLEHVSPEPSSFLMPRKPMPEDSSWKERRKCSFKSLGLSISYDETTLVARCWEHNTESWISNSEYLFQYYSRRSTSQNPSELVLSLPMPVSCKAR